MNQEQSYNKLKEEVKTFVEEVSAALSKDAEIMKLYKGWRIMFSPLVSKPAVMFIGINPGAGQPGVIDLDHSDKERLEYLDWDYDLARETKSIFNSLGASHLLTNQSVKTNFFYLSTAAENDLYKITDFLGRRKKGGEELLGDKVFSRAYEWTRKLIKLIQLNIPVMLTPVPGDTDPLNKFGLKNPRD